MKIAEALRLLRIREGLSQTAASKRDGAPDYRTLSQWETRHKVPSLKLLGRYLRSQGWDLHDLQDAMDQAAGRPPRRFRRAMRGVEDRLGDVEERLERLEAGGSEDVPKSEQRPDTAAAATAPRVRAAHLSSPAAPTDVGSAATR